MTQLTPDSQVSAFRLILDFENRGQEVESIVARLKQMFLVDATSVSLPDAIGTLHELRWHLTTILERLNDFERAVGIQRNTRQKQTQGRRVIQNHSLRGSTRTIRIPDLIALLASQQKTGTLWVKTKTERFALELLEGAVVHAASDSPRPDQRLGTILVAQNKVSTEKLDEFLARYCRGDGRIGEMMARANLVTEEDLCGALEFQVRALFQRLFALDDAVFCFCDGPVSELELRVTLNTTQLLLETARATDEERMRAAQASEAALDELIGPVIEERGDDVTVESGHEQTDTATEESAPQGRVLDADGAPVPTDDVTDETVAAGVNATENGLGGATAECGSEGAEPDATTTDDSRAFLAFASIPGVNRSVALELVGAGVRTLGDLALATDEELLGVPGLGEKTLKAIRDHLSRSVPPPRLEPEPQPEPSDAVS